MNYDELLGKTRAMGLKQKDLAVAAQMTESTMSLKLAGKYPFTADEIRRIVEKLGIAPEQIGTYFFTQKV